MKKLLILLSFLSLPLFASPAKAGCFNCAVYGYGYGYGYNYYGSLSDQVAYGVTQFFNTLQESMYLVNQDRAANQNIAIRRNILENNKSIERYNTEGIPPFAPIAPDGKPRSPKITWQDVESIH